MENKEISSLESNNFEQNYDVVIIGGGPAGATAAIYTARAGLKTLVIDKGLTAGALGITGKIANYPGFDEIKGADLLEKIRGQARAFGAKFVFDRVIGVDLLSETRSVFTNTGVFSARAVIIATGSMGRKNLIKGEGEYLGRGVSYCAVCDAAFFKDKEVAVAGSNDEAIEEALYLARFVNKVHFISPTSDLKAPQHLVDELMKNPQIHLYPDANLREINGNGQVESVRIIKKRGEGDQEIPVKGAFIYLQGGQPVTDFLQGQLDINENGCVVVDREFQTTIPGVFAIGDVLCNHIKQAVIAAGDGATAGISAERYLTGRKQVSYQWSK